jgi:SagB-type dehydrogenase family enzyme
MTFVEDIMRRSVGFVVSAVFGFLLVMGLLPARADDPIRLPVPVLTSDTSVEKAISERRSVRSYKSEPLQVEDIGQVLWAAQGITDPAKGLRAAPSPRSAYLIKVYVVAADVKGLTPGVYRYEPKGHELTRVVAGDRKGALYDAVGQSQIKSAPAVLVIAGDMAKSGNQSWPFLEAGHVSENVYLQCVSLKLGTVTMAGFKSDQAKKALGLQDKEDIIYLMPLGKK